LSAKGESEARRVQAQYEVERALAQRLRLAPREERRRLYRIVYDEFFRQFPLETQVADHSVDVAWQLSLLAPFLRPDTVFMEVGAGDGRLALEIARRVRTVYAIDVSEEATTRLADAENVRLILSDGISIPVAEGSVSVAYSSQLMEHLHPDDAGDQLENVFRSLQPSGVYVCVTPNRLSGPHDVSKFFDPVATGFHLHEYTVAELARLFREVGFSGVRVVLGARGRYASASPAPIIGFESLVARLPRRVRRRVAASLPARALLGIRLVGRKGPKQELSAA
jgi:SAM-dependent methyltransferase